MNNSIFVRFEDVFKYGRVGGISKGMTNDEVGSVLLSIPTDVDTDKTVMEVSFLSLDGVEIRFCKEKVSAITIYMDEMYESEYFFDFDEWILQELSYLNPDDIAVSLMGKNLSFSYKYDEESRLITITLAQSGVKLQFYPLSDGESYLDYELYCIEI